MKTQNAHYQADLSSVKEGQTVDISTIEQIASMTPEQFAIFHKDLANWFSVVQKVKAVNKFTGFLHKGGIVKFDTEAIRWVYDNQGRGIINIHAIDENGEKVKGMGEVKYTHQF